MKKKIATLDVYINDTGRLTKADEPRGSYLFDVDRENNHYELMLNPRGDRELLSMLKSRSLQEEFPKPRLFREAVLLEPERLKPAQFATIAAHELGHFLAKLTNDVTHDPGVRGSFGPAIAEERAWQLAEMIKPDYDVETARVALQSYSPQYSELPHVWEPREVESSSR